jgi:hypothetical protein
MALERNISMDEPIYVALLNEGIDVWRPVSAKALGDGEFQIIGNVPSDEEWQFAPGTRVRCKDMVFENGERGLVAYEVAL